MVNTRCAAPEEKRERLTLGSHMHAHTCAPIPRFLKKRKRNYEENVYLQKISILCNDNLDESSQSVYKYTL